MSAKPVAVSDEQFESTVIQSDLPVLVDFWAPWCGPCRLVAPVLEELAQEYSGRVVVAKVDTDQNHLHALKFGVQGIPTMILFDGGAEVDRVVGALPKSALKLWIDSKVAN